MQQLELGIELSQPDRLTVSGMFDLLWRYNLQHKPSGAGMNGNRKAWCRSSGGIYVDQLTELDIENHIRGRMAGRYGRKPAGPQTIRHDLMLMRLALNMLRKLKRKRYTIDGILFEFMKLPDFDPLEDVKRPRLVPVRRTITPNNLAAFMEHTSDKLRRIFMFAIDTGFNEIDLRALTPEHYDTTIDAFVLYRHKTGRRYVKPVTDRVRSEVLRAKVEGRPFILDFTNYWNEIKKIRRRTGIFFEPNRAIRRTHANEILDLANGDITAAQEALAHSSTRSTEVYITRRPKRMRLLVRKLEKRFS